MADYLSAGLQPDDPWMNHCVQTSAVADWSAAERLTASKAGRRMDGLFRDHIIGHGSLNP